MLSNFCLGEGREVAAFAFAKMPRIDFSRSERLISATPHKLDTGLRSEFLWLVPLLARWRDRKSPPNLLLGGPTRVVLMAESGPTVAALLNPPIAVYPARRFRDLQVSFVEWQNALVMI
jgi:hypothetical protein